MSAAIQNEIFTNFLICHIITFRLWWPNRENKTMDVLTGGLFSPNTTRTVHPFFCGRIMKKCSKCKVLKPRNCFYANNKMKCGLTSSCKTCLLDASKKRREDPESGFKEKRKDYYLKNRERILEGKRNYYLKNRKTIRKKMSNYEKERLKTDTVFALTKRFRRRMGEALSRLGLSGSRRIEDSLGCSPIEFKDHIERQFLKGMTWENRDQWHLDHIIPISSAKTEEEVYALSHFTNIRPLWAKENIQKRNKQTHLI